MLNKQSTEWLAVKKWLNTQVNQATNEMVGGLTIEEYNTARGKILLARQLIEEVEPTTPPQTSEPDYGISPASSEYI